MFCIFTVFEISHQEYIRILKLVFQSLFLEEKRLIILPYDTDSDQRPGRQKPLRGVI
jgi:hypothetical protein